MAPRTVLTIGIKSCRRFSCVDLPPAVTTWLRSPMSRCTGDAQKTTHGDDRQEIQSRCPPVPPSLLTGLKTPRTNVSSSASTWCDAGLDVQHLTFASVLFAGHEQPQRPCST
jgi:hypothetical protein